MFENIVEQSVCVLAVYGLFSIVIKLVSLNKTESSDKTERSDKTECSDKIECSSDNSSESMNSIDFIVNELSDEEVEISTLRKRRRTVN